MEGNMRYVLNCDVFIIGNEADGIHGVKRVKVMFQSGAPWRSPYKGAPGGAQQ